MGGKHLFASPMDLTARSCFFAMALMHRVRRVLWSGVPSCGGLTVSSDCLSVSEKLATADSWSLAFFCSKTVRFGWTWVMAVRFL